MVFLASTVFAQKTPKIDSLITPTDTLVFVKDTVKLSKLELLVKQATEKQTKPTEAIALYKKALAAKTKSQDSNWVGDIKFAMAKMYFKAGNSTDGFLNLLAAQSLYSQSLNISCQSAITQEIAAIYEANNDWTEAEKFYQLAIKQQESIGLTMEMPYTLLAFANGYYKRKDYAKAEKYYNAALNQFELNREKNKRADALVQLADIKIKQKNYAQAEHMILKRAMPFFSAVGKPDARIACFNMLGDIYYIQNRQSEAKWFYIQAQTMYKNKGDVTGNIRSIVNLAKVKSALGDKKSAYKDFKDAEAMAIKRKDLALAADVKVAYAKYYNKPFPKATAAKAEVSKSDARLAVNSKSTASDSVAVKTKSLVKKGSAIDAKAVKLAAKKDTSSVKVVKTAAVVKTTKPVVKKDSVVVNSKSAIAPKEAKPSSSIKSTTAKAVKADSSAVKTTLAAAKKDTKVTATKVVKTDSSSVKANKATPATTPKTAVKDNKTAAKPVKVVVAKADTSVKTLAKKEDKPVSKEKAGVKEKSSEKEEKVVVAEN